MDIFEDYEAFKNENYDFIYTLVKNKSNAITRFTPVIAVVDFLNDKYNLKHKLSSDEQLAFSTGFDYIYDQFYLIKTIFEYSLKNDTKLFDKLSTNINLLLYINEIKIEALNNDALTEFVKPLSEFYDKVLKITEKKEVIDDGYFQYFHETLESMFTQNNIEFYTMDQIFYEMALEYGIMADDDFDIYNEFLARQIAKTRN